MIQRGIERYGIDNDRRSRYNGQRIGKNCIDNITPLRGLGPRQRASALMSALTGNDR
nr:MAG TPA: hypothetical protein [Caudoviricetes sp.]